MSAGLKRREARARADLDKQISDLIDVANELRGEPPAMVADRLRVVVSRAIWTAQAAGQLMEAIRVQHPAKGTGP